MAEDIAPGLRKNVEQSYRNSVANDSELARIREKIDEGTATGKDLDAYAVRSGELLAQALHEHVSGDILPNGRMYYNIANRLLPPVLRQNYEDVADVSDAIQTIMNEQAGIGIKAQRPELNEDRVEGLVDLASEAEQYEDIRKELEGDVVNFSQSVATDSVKSNAEFQYQSGLSPKVERTAEPSCCPWCQKLENTYDYADIRGTGNEVWQRHRACRCVVEYVAAGKRQNAHTKQVSTMDREASAERIQRAQEAEKQDREQEEKEREERIRRAEEVQRQFETERQKELELPREFRNARFANPILPDAENFLDSLGALGVSEDITPRDWGAVQRNWQSFNRKENIGKIVTVSTMDYVYTVEVLSLEDYNILWKIPNDDNLNDAVAKIKRRRI